MWKMTEYAEAGLEKTVFWSGWNAGEVGMPGTHTTEKAENQFSGRKERSGQ